MAIKHLFGSASTSYKGLYPGLRSVSTNNVRAVKDQPFSYFFKKGEESAGYKPVEYFRIRDEKTYLVPACYNRVDLPQDSDFTITPGLQKSDFYQRIHQMNGILRYDPYNHPLRRQLAIHLHRVGLEFDALEQLRLSKALKSYSQKKHRRKQRLSDPLLFSHRLEYHFTPVEGWKYLREDRGGQERPLLKKILSIAAGIMIFIAGAVVNAQGKPGHENTELLPAHDPYSNDTPSFPGADYHNGDKSAGHTFLLRKTPEGHQERMVLNGILKLASSQKAEATPTEETYQEPAQKKAAQGTIIEWKDKHVTEQITDSATQAPIQGTTINYRLLDTDGAPAQALAGYTFTTNEQGTDAQNILIRKEKPDAINTPKTNDYGLAISTHGEIAAHMRGKIKQISILNILGQYQQQYDTQDDDGQEKIQADIERLAPGTYLAIAQDEKGAREILKFIKNNNQPEGWQTNNTNFNPTQEYEQTNNKKAAKEEGEITTRYERTITAQGYKEKIDTIHYKYNNAADTTITTKIAKIPTQEKDYQAIINVTNKDNNTAVTITDQYGNPLGSGKAGEEITFQTEKDSIPNAKISINAQDAQGLELIKTLKPGTNNEQATLNWIYNTTIKNAKEGARITGTFNGKTVFDYNATNQEEIKTFIDTLLQGNLHITATKDNYKTIEQDKQATKGKDTITLEVMLGQYTTALRNVIPGTNITWKDNDNGSTLLTGTDATELYRELPQDTESVKAILEKTGYKNDTVLFINALPGTTTKNADQQAIQQENTFDIYAILTNETADSIFTSQNTNNGKILITLDKDGQTKTYDLTNQRKQHIQIIGAYEATDSITIKQQGVEGYESGRGTLKKNRQRPTASNGQNNNGIRTTIGDLANDTTYYLILRSNLLQDEHFLQHVDGGREYNHTEYNPQTGKQELVMNINGIMQSYHNNGSYADDLTQEEKDAIRRRINLFNQEFWDRKSGLSILKVNINEKQTRSTTAGNSDTFYWRDNSVGNLHFNLGGEANCWDVGLGFAPSGDYLGQFSAEHIQEVFFIKDAIINGSTSIQDVFTRDEQDNTYIINNSSLITNMTYEGGKAPKQ